jgi:predicted cupin superfamily sugar epimerase
MQHRIQQLISQLNLQPHPEGGYFAETYRAEESIDTQNGQRNLMTAIYFLLTSDDISRFHVIQSDELWFHHEGSDLSVHVLDETGHQILRVGKNHPDARAQQLVPAGKIFGSTVNEPHSYALVSCVVAPGFDFRDFKLMDKSELLEKYPDFPEIIARLGC